MYPFVLPEAGMPHGQRVEEDLKMGFLELMYDHFGKKGGDFWNITDKRADHRDRQPLFEVGWA